ncbi:sulfotransferase family protein [Mangrovimicrobium sediminis]|uniref:Sulfotransferase family protein n=2 Tax=Mangrovimicrobium sediminis TaxID=2562682 RepID=A0A4Z0MA53_9GAMM|nr:sulfotransferase family protein [Haliea sp. SAOS-164]
MSLKVALEQLGYPCYHMVECFPKGPAHWKLWEQVGKSEPDWDAVFAGYTATVDFPACTSYAALAKYYPDAKVVLTVRDPDAWFQSVQDTIFGREWLEFLPGTEAGAYLQATINDYFDDRMHDRDHLVQRFHEHVAEVKSTIAPERLLVFEVSQGWEPLCRFLEVPVPEGDFPRINDTAAVQGVIRDVMDRGFQAALGYAG